MRKEATGRNLGSARICSDADVVANTPGEWRITYTCGATPVTPGGLIRFEIPYGFTPPQTAYRSAVGFTSVTTPNPTVRISLLLRDPRIDKYEHGVWGYYAYVRIDEGTLVEGDTVSLLYGKGDGQGLTNEGAFAQYFEAEVEFTVAVNPDGRNLEPHGGFLMLDTPQPSLRVVGGEAEHLFVAVPSLGGVGEALPVKITVRDREGNTVRGFSGEVTVRATNGTEQRRRFAPEDGGRGVVTVTAPDSEGVVYVSASDKSARIRGVSNPCLCRESAPGLRAYWGDIHTMTRISAGLGRPAEAYAYARDASHLDFCAITDGDKADGFCSDEEWDEIVEATRRFYDPGRFVTLLGSEYHERRVAGDKNIYYRTGDGPLLRWCDLEGEQPEALWRALHGRKALTVPHHTVSTDRFRPWDHHDPDYQRLVEIYSDWGNSEGEGCARPFYWRHNLQNSVQQGLAKGYRLGIIASGDSHDGLPGNSSWMRLRRGYRGGLVAVYAPELTRVAVFDALWDRYCYGTSGARILLSFELNSARMGEEIDTPADRAERTLRVDALGTGPISNITVIRNGRTAYTHQGRSAREGFEWTDTEDFAAVALPGFDGKPFIYYYVRVTQMDGELAWSSPIWIV